MMKLNLARLVLTGGCLAAVFCVQMLNPGLVQPLGAADAKYGTLTGQFVLDGAVPSLKALVTKGDPAVRDAAICSADTVPDDSLVVNPTSKGIANIFVYIKKAKDVHPSLKTPASPTVDFDQKGCRFFPHALFVRTNQTVKVLSDDAIAHNTHTFPLRNQAANTAIKPKERVGVPYSNPITESLPMEVKCDFHPWMKAYWLVLDHPYAAVTDKDGKFTIENLPAGEHEFVVWQEKSGYVERKLKVDVKGGSTTNLGAVKVPVAKFK